MSETKTIGQQNEDLKTIQKIVNKKLEWTGLKTIELNKNEVQEVDETFTNVKDFRSLWEKITAPIDNIIDKTSKIIESDPIMDVSETLSSVNNNVQKVYKEIINDDWTFMKFLKSIPVIGEGVKALDNKFDDLKFNMKETKWKIEIIFSGFDQSYESLNKSIDMQKSFLDSLEENLWKVESYKEYVSKKLVEFKKKYENETNDDKKQKYKMFVQQIEYFLGNIETLIGNLELAKKRMLMRLDSAVKLSLAMNSSRPIFKTLLSVAIIETSWQKALDASMESMEAMWKTIDNMSKDLTDQAVESSKKAEEITQKPVLDTKVFIGNVEKLKNHFDEIENYRKQVAQQTKEERKSFEEATNNLKELKKVNKEDYDELQENLNNK